MILCYFYNSIRIRISKYIDINRFELSSCIAPIRYITLQQVI